jgi:uncharacterized membrane protein (DUF4010 family)
MSPALDSLTRLGAALAIGLLIGLERGWEQREKSEGERIAGIRTFGLVALLGAVAVLIGADHWPVLAAMALGVEVIAAVGYYRASDHDRSATGTIALLVTFALGALAGQGNLAVAAAAAVIVALLLGLKPEMHDLLRSIEREELLGTIRLLLISVVVLPVLPNVGFGPWHVLNPYRLWWMVVLVAGISYVGYFAKRIWGGERGALLTGLLGGIVSSTAVTLTLSRRAGGAEPGVGTLAAGILVASAMMFPRLLAIVAPVAPALFWPLVQPLTAAAFIGFVAAWILARRAGAEPPPRQREAELRNPLELATAIQFGALLACVIVGSRALSAWIGPTGTIVAAAMAGVAEVDAIALSVADLSNSGAVAAPTAVGAVLTAAAVNTGIKVGIAFAVGGRRIGGMVAPPLLLALLAGALTAWAAHPA